jgi:hypothetical protein
MTFFFASLKSAKNQFNYNDKVHLEKLKVSRTAIGSTNDNSEVCSVTSGSQVYDEKLNSGFKDLIAQLKNKQKGIKRKAENDLITTNGESVTTRSIINDPSQTVSSTTSNGDKVTDNNMPSSLLISESPSLDTIQSTVSLKKCEQSINLNLEKKSPQNKDKAPSPSQQQSTASLYLNSLPKRKNPYRISPPSQKQSSNNLKLPPNQGHSTSWNCSACTFKNEIKSWSRIKTARCAICGTLRVENEEKNETTSSCIKIDC